MTLRIFIFWSFMIKEHWNKLATWEKVIVVLFSLAVLSAMFPSGCGIKLYFGA